VTAPPVVTRPVLSAPASVNQSAPSGPEVIPFGKLMAVGTLNVVILPAAAAAAGANEHDKYTGYYERT
jgi:hypothetical protein